MTYDHILVSQEGPVGRIQLNRPQVLNALNDKLLAEVLEATTAFDANAEVRCILLHGNEKAFAAGADIKEMADRSFAEQYTMDVVSLFDAIYKTRKPMVAAVSGYALGGGCELAMICDIIVASETAKFGQPEINIGVIPGAGGTQRLPRAVGKSLAMEMVLTGRMLTAQEAKAAGLVSRVVPVEAYLDEALKLAQEIASKAPVAAMAVKEAVKQGYENTLMGGQHVERRLFYMLFATDDQKEGMKAFVERRKPEWTGK